MKANNLKYKSLLSYAICHKPEQNKKVTDACILKDGGYGGFTQLQLNIYK